VVAKYSDKFLNQLKNVFKNVVETKYFVEVVKYFSFWNGQMQIIVSIITEKPLNLT